MIVIQPAQPDTVYVPSYDPAAVYGSSWPYPSYPPYYPATPPGYYFGTALATGLAFAAGAAVVGGLWGWASPGWGGGYANVNVNRYNNINAIDRRLPLTVSVGAPGARVLAISPARRADRRAFPAVLRSLCPATRCGLRPDRAASEGWAALVGRAVPAAWVGLAGRAVARRRRWTWPARRPGGVGGAGGAGRPGGPGGVAASVARPARRSRSVVGRAVPEASAA